MRTGHAKSVNTLTDNQKHFYENAKKCKGLYNSLHFRFYTLHFFPSEDYRKRSSKTVPDRSLRSSSMLPLWFRMICREMLRPMPEPSFFVV